MKPIIYLDVDDVLVSFPHLFGTAGVEFYQRNPEGAPAIGAREFIRWAMVHTEIRWLSHWCPSGALEPEQVESLASILQIPNEWLESIKNPLPFFHASATPRMATLRTNGIDWMEDYQGRDWAWIGASISVEESKVLRKCDRIGNHYECNTSFRRRDLIKVHEQLKARWLPCAVCFQNPSECECDTQPVAVPASSR